MNLTHSIFSPCLKKLLRHIKYTGKTFVCLGRPHFSSNGWNQAWYRNWITPGCLGNSLTKISFYGNQSNKLDRYLDVINCLLTSDEWVESGVILKTRKKGVEERNGISQSCVVYKGNIVDEMVVAWVNIWGFCLIVDFLSRYVLEKRIFCFKKYFYYKI